MSSTPTSVTLRPDARLPLLVVVFGAALLPLPLLPLPLLLPRLLLLTNWSGKNRYRK